MRTGTETSSRVKSLEAHIAELESECDRLSKALDVQKSSVVEGELVLGRRMEDVSREVQRKVRRFPRGSIYLFGF